jgi:CRP/FNR family cyclic AMP-dependent transcriptional regulator
MDTIDFGLLARAADETLTFSAGEVIFTAGDAASQLFVVKSGEVDILVHDTVVETLTQGGIFGELALIDHAPRSATAVARTEIEVVAVSERQFLFMVSEAPFFALSVMRVLARRLRQTNKAL